VGGLDEHWILEMAHIPVLLMLAILERTSYYISLQRVENVGNMQNLNPNHSFPVMDSQSTRGPTPEATKKGM
jgi:hypothetical protein